MADLMLESPSNGEVVPNGSYLNYSESIGGNEESYNPQIIISSTIPKTGAYSALGPNICKPRIRVSSTGNRFKLVKIKKDSL